MNTIIEQLLERIELLELNQQRLALILSHGHSPVKAWDYECFSCRLTFDQEARSRKAIVDFLGSDSTDLDALLDKVEAIVGNRFDAKRIVGAFKERGTATERWKVLDPDDTLPRSLYPHIE